MVNGERWSEIVKRLQEPPKLPLTQGEMWQERATAAVVISILMKELLYYRDTFSTLTDDPPDRIELARAALLRLERLPL